MVLEHITVHVLPRACLAVQVDQLVDDSFSDHNELECLVWLRHTEQQEASQAVDSHNVVKIPLNCLVELRNDSLGRVDSLQTRLELPFLSVQQG